MRTPRCTVIIPACNAEGTITETLASVRAQTTPDWRAIVVDDGSTDATAQRVREVAAREERIVLVPGLSRGVGAARNVGIRAATTPMISFLDADDLLAPAFLERMLPPLENDVTVAATYCGWLRLAPDGETEEGPSAEQDGDLFDLFAAACIFPPHACVVRCRVVNEVDGFDEAPTTTEDWDLWQRIARTGARFVRVPGNLVIYRMRTGSRSRDSHRVMSDGLAVIAQGHAPDPRVRRPHPAHAQGADARRYARRAYNHLSWAAGVAIASGEDPLPLLGALAGQSAPDLDEWEVGGTLLEGMRVALCSPPGRALAIVAPRGDAVFAFLGALEDAAGARGLAQRVARALDQRLGEQTDPAGPRTLLTQHEATVELAQPVENVEGLPERIDRMIVALWYGGAPVGAVELPVSHGKALAGEITNAAAAEAGWRLLERYLTRTVFPGLRVEPAPEGWLVCRDRVPVGGPVAAIPPPAQFFELAGWTVFIQELFGMPRHTLDEIYAPDSPGDGASLVLAEPVLDLDLSDPVRGWLTRAAEVQVRCTVGGSPLISASLPVVGGILAPGPVRRALTAISTADLVRLAVREGIIGWPLESVVPLRERLAQRRRTARPAQESWGPPVPPSEGRGAHWSPRVPR